MPTRAQAEARLDRALAERTRLYIRAELPTDAEDRAAWRELFMARIEVRRFEYADQLREMRGCIDDLETMSDAE